MSVKRPLSVKKRVFPGVVAAIVLPVVYLWALGRLGGVVAAEAIRRRRLMDGRRAGEDPASPDDSPDLPASAAHDHRYS